MLGPVQISTVMPQPPPPQPHSHALMNHHNQFPPPAAANPNMPFNFLTDPASQAAVGEWQGMAQTSVEQDQLLSDFFGAPGQAGSETNLLATLWNHDVFDEFSDFFESTGVDMGRAG